MACVPSVRANRYVDPAVHAGCASVVNPAERTRCIAGTRSPRLTRRYTFCTKLGSAGMVVSENKHLGVAHTCTPAHPV